MLAKAARLTLPLVLLASCGKDEVAPLPQAVATHTGLLSRLVVDASVPGGYVGEVEEVAAFRLTRTNRKECPWITEGGDKTIKSLVQPPGGSNDRQDYLAALGIRGVGPKSFTHKFPFQSGEVNSVQLLLSCIGTGSEMVRVVTLDSDGDAAETSPVRSIAARAEPYVLQFPIERPGSNSEKRTGIRVEFIGSQDHAALLSMSATHSPDHELLPALGTGTQVEVDHSSRFAAGLLEGSPWEAALDCGGEQDGKVRLSMSLARPKWARRMTKSAKLIVSYESVDGPAELAVAVPRGKKARWHEVAVDLKGLIAGESLLGLSLVDQDATSSALLVGDPVVTQRVQKPQTILLITSDTHRADHMGLARSGARVDTPTLDRLGRRGIYFEDCQSTTNVTNPSHIAILSGIHPRDTQIVDNTTQLSAQVETLAEVFQANGYRTFASVSTQHLEHSQSGLGQGFDRFGSTELAKRTGDHSIRQIEDWLKDAEGTSAFIWLHLFDAHAPYAPPSRSSRSALAGISKKGPGLGIDDSYVPLWVAAKGVTNADYVDALYGAEVDYVDEALTDLLESPRIADAWVAFTSDHGESLRSHNVYWDHAGLFLPMVDVPLIIAGPGLEARRSATTVQQIDLGRTLINLAGIDDSTYPGRDLIQAAVDESPDEARFAISAHGLQASVSVGPWFYVMDLRDYATPTLALTWTHGQGQLFDRRLGVNTEESLVAEHPEQASRMRERLIEFLESGSTEVLGSASAVDVGAQANLEALGYAGFTARAENTWWTPSQSQEDDGDND